MALQEDYLITAVHLVTIYFSLVLCRWAYRLSPLHPLASYPTPSRLASISRWYEFYRNVIQDGKFLFEIEKWHEEYGPIIRIGPNELSINDPDFYNTLYAANYKFAAYPPHYGYGGSVDVTVTITDPVIHKSRRAIWNRFFSKTQIQNLNDIIQDNIRKLTEVITEYAGIQAAGVPMSVLFRCLTLDTISEYAFSESLNTLRHGCDSPIAEGIRRTVAHVWLFNFIWPFQYLATMLPYNVASLVIPKSLSGLVDLQKVVGAQVDDVVQTLMSPTRQEKMRQRGANSNQATIFQYLLDGTTPRLSGKPVSALKFTRDTLVGEAMMLLGAAMETTASLLANAIYQASIDQLIQHRIHNELLQAFPNKSFNDIDPDICERLPYLTAFIKENLRFTPASPGRSPRIVPKDGTFCGNTYIPPDTVVSMSIYLMHHNATVYTNPKVFDPDRWLDVAATSPQERYFVPFSKGSKSCFGIYLAYAEIYGTLAALFRRFKFTLHKDNQFTEKWVDYMILDNQADLVVSVEEYDH
ncbi:hypothetical protein TWF506_007355 [Arthrobotrys conoides]|uniref:Cytochrome P450 n=1 Tax=Arthrobotrys conoides TaxID=74498 RepID=A0AAN8NAE2_9PEZI